MMFHQRCCFACLICFITCIAHQRWYRYQKGSGSSERRGGWRPLLSYQCCAGDCCHISCWDSANCTARMFTSIHVSSGHVSICPSVHVSACKDAANITALLQRWDGETKLIENGIYLGHIASLKFTGPWAMNKVTILVPTVDGHACTCISHAAHSRSPHQKSNPCVQQKTACLKQLGSSVCCNADYRKRWTLILTASPSSWGLGSSALI